MRSFYNETDKRIIIVDNINELFYFTLDISSYKEFNFPEDIKDIIGNGEFIISYKLNSVILVNLLVTAYNIENIENISHVIYVCGNNDDMKKIMKYFKHNIHVNYELRRITFKTENFLEEIPSDASYVLTLLKNPYGKNYVIWDIINDRLFAEVK